MKIDKENTMKIDKENKMQLAGKKYNTDKVSRHEYHKIYPLQYYYILEKKKNDNNRLYFYRNRLYKVNQVELISIQTSVIRKEKKGSWFIL